MAQQDKQPIKEFRVGSISAAIWRNEKEQDGETIVRHSVKIQKRFRKDDGTWADSDYLFPEDLPKVQLIVAESYKYISLRESKDAEESIPV
jgi:hypothetical protein